MKCYNANCLILWASRPRQCPQSTVSILYHRPEPEYRVLECLARNLGFIIAQNQLIREVWGPEHLGDTRSLRVCIKSLRDKLEPVPSKPRYLINEMGIGYRLRSDPGPAASEAPFQVPSADRDD